MDYDLIEREGNDYYIADPVLALWIKYSLLEGGPEYESFRHSAETWLIQLRERVETLSTELGVAQESVVRELLEQLAGRAVEGRWFRQNGELTVPHFEQVSGYRSANGQIEADALAEDTRNGQRWVVEVKWRNRAVGVKELEALQTKAEALCARGWCISRMGFTAQSLDWAAERDILLSTATDLQALQRLVNGD